MTDELKKTFRPEFLNRIDEIVIFHALTPEHIVRIVDLEVKEVAKRIVEHGLSLELTEAARQWLGKNGYDQQYGARPLKRLIQRALETPLSSKLLSGVFKAGDHVVVDAGEDGLTMTKQAPAAIEPVGTQKPIEA